MEYKIHHIDLIEPANQQPFFEEEVQKKMGHLQKLLQHYPKELVLEVFVSREGESDYTVTASLNMKGKEILIKEKGSKAVIVVNSALDKLRRLVKEEVELERREHLRKRKNRFHAAAETLTPELKKHIKNEDRTSFTRLVIKILPEIQAYIKKQISKKPALVQLLKQNVLTVNDIVDEVYAALYQELQNDTDASEKFVLGAFAVADREINKLNEKYSREFRTYISTGELNKKEMKDLQEELTANADFMPVLTEELDETYFYPGEYDLHEILVDAGADKEIIEQAEASDMDLGPFISELPEEQRSVFEWYYMYYLDTNEIARVKNVQESKVLQWLKDARAQLLSSLQEHAL